MSFYVNKKKSSIQITPMMYDLTYEDYIKKKIILQKYKITQLKAIAKQYRLLITGTKKVIIERIENLFHNTKSALIIQRVFRGNIVRLFLKLRGPAYKDRSICVNETDGYTLEPLKEIPLERFFSYKDSKNFIYGFDLLSLLKFYKNKVKIINPYTRERVDNNILNQILSLGKITKILCPEIFADYEETNIISVEPSRPVIQNRIISIRENGQMAIINRIRNILQWSGTAEQINLINKLYEIKCRPIHTRINDLFIEIDMLGNYTQSQWFQRLDKSQYIRYFRLLYNYWNSRGQIPQETRIKICQFFDPFLNMTIPFVNYDYISLEQIQEICISVMENMIYCGVDTEYRKLGALYVLSILTVVSIDARNSMFWLYESLDY